MNRGMRAVNVTLLVLLVIVTVSGWLAFAVGSPGAAGWIVGVHGASGLGLLLLVPAKTVIARRGLRKPGRSRKVISWVFVALVGISIASGLLHAIGGWRTYRLPPFPPLLPMQIHVGAGIGAAALLVWHVLLHQRRRHGWRPLLRRTDLTRRRALLGTGIAAGSAVLWVVAPGQERRETGSHEIVDAAQVPVTQWLFDRVPSEPFRAIDLAGLPRMSVRAVLDCTGGWYTEQEWRGVPIDALGLPRGASIDVVSVTGYRRRFPAGADLLSPPTWPGAR